MCTKFSKHTQDISKFQAPEGLDTHTLVPQHKIHLPGAHGARDFCTPHVVFNDAQRLQLGLPREKQAGHIE
jgi:hypothetical protein